MTDDALLVAGLSGPNVTCACKSRSGRYALRPGAAASVRWWHRAPAPVETSEGAQTGAVRPQEREEALGTPNSPLPLAAVLAPRSGPTRRPLPREHD
jgi:hypothetical protein